MTVIRLGFLVAASLASVAFPAIASSNARSLPAWLSEHVGEASGQIAPVVLERARDLYRRNVANGKVNNPCYFAMDATRPNDVTSGKSGGRFYTICEASQSFHVISSGHGSGGKLPGIAPAPRISAMPRIRN